MNATTTIHGSYSRKSSEAEDRQVLSLESQLDKVRDLAKSLGVHLDEKNILSESKSAKVTGKRAQFSEMVARIERGDINAIIVWHADRLSRNAIDSAMLIDCMDRGKLIEIVTPGQTFRNTPFDKFMFMLQCTQAKMENDKKGVDVKRGLMKKAEMGVFPGLAPIGYGNDKYGQKGDKKIPTDPERFVLLRKCWELMLSGTYSPLKIREIATNEWGLRTKKGKKLARSGIYWIFRNPFYYGMFEYPQGSGQWWQGTHEPMVTPEEFDRVQAIMGRDGRPRPKTQVFEFTGMVHCGQCGAMVTAEFKTKRQKNGNIHTYVFYHCTHRRAAPCRQGSIEVGEFKKQVIDEIDSIEIPPEFHSFAMKWFRAENAREGVEQQVVLGSQEKAYNAIVAKLSALLDMRAAGEITPEAFAQKQTQYLAEKHEFKKRLDQTDDRVNQWNRTGDEMLTFIEQAKDRFKNGTLQTKRTILSTLGSNLLLKDKILSIDTEKCLFPMKKISLEVKEIKRRFEPPENVDKQADFERLCLENPTVLPEHYLNIPLFFNRQFMQQMAQRLAVIKLMQRTEGK